MVSKTTTGEARDREKRGGGPRAGTGYQVEYTCIQLSEAVVLVVIINRNLMSSPDRALRAIIGDCHVQHDHEKGLDRLLESI